MQNVCLRNFCPGTWKYLLAAEVEAHESGEGLGSSGVEAVSEHEMGASAVRVGDRRWEA